MRGALGHRLLATLVAGFAAIVVAEPAAGADALEQASVAGCVPQPDGRIILASTVRGTEGGKPRLWIALEREIAGGQPDASFGRGGTALLKIAGADAEASGVSLLADGRIVVAATLRRGEQPSGADALLARFLPDGNPDGAFGRQGWLAEDLGGRQDEIAGLALDGQSGAFVVGSSLRSFWALTTRYDFAVARVKSDGTLDDRFGKGGKAFVRVGSVSDDKGKAAVAAPDGDILLAGYSRHSSTPDFTVVRLTPTGSRDLRFGTLGWKIVRMSEKGSQANDLALQSDGKVVVVGDQYEQWRKPHGLRAIVVRLLASGAFDARFGEDGIAELKLPDAEPASFTRVALQPDGRILAAGVATATNGQRRILVARWLPDGRPDLAFGTRGAVRIPLAARSADPRSVHALPDGHVLLCGETQDIAGAAAPPRGGGRFVMRLAPDGSPAAPTPR